MSTSLRLRSREEWGASPSQSSEASAHPLGQVIIKTSGTESTTCDNDKECSLLLKNLQKRHMTELKYPDIAYNFLVASDGTIYEGRGWTIRGEVIDEKYRDFHASSIVVAYLGDFTEDTPPPLMTSAVEALVRFGKEIGYIAEKNLIVKTDKYDEANNDENESE